MTNETSNSVLSTTRFPVAKLVALVSAGFVVVLTIMTMTQRSMYYATDQTDPGAAIMHFPKAQDIRLTTDDGLKLSAWKVIPEEPNGKAVLYLPGNGGNRLHRAEVGQALADEGFTVLLMDYRGFGGNPGEPTEEGLVCDARAALLELNDSGFANEDVLFVGESIGGGVATQLATTQPPAAMLLRSPFTSLADAAEYRLKLPIGFLVWDQFDSLSYAPNLDMPVAVLAGSDDAIVPAKQSRQLADAFPNLIDFTEIDGAGHNDELWFGPFLAEQVTALANATAGAKP